MAKAGRTTHRSRTGKKLYAVREAGGRFKEIQTYERAHREDLATTSKQEGTDAARSSTTGKPNTTACPRSRCGWKAKWSRSSPRRWRGSSVRRGEGFDPEGGAGNWHCDGVCAQLAARR
jgi:hypothetical protein